MDRAEQLEQGTPVVNFSSLGFNGLEQYLLTLCKSASGGLNIDLLTEHEPVRTVRTW